MQDKILPEIHCCLTLLPLLSVFSPSHEGSKGGGHWIRQ
jgi:hypothetical protein